MLVICVPYEARRCSTSSDLAGTTSRLMLHKCAITTTHPPLPDRIEATSRWVRGPALRSCRWHSKSTLCMPSAQALTAPCPHPQRDVPGFSPLSQPRELQWNVTIPGSLWGMLIPLLCYVFSGRGPVPLFRGRGTGPTWHHRVSHRV